MTSGCVFYKIYQMHCVFLGGNIKCGGVLAAARNCGHTRRLVLCTFRLPLLLLRCFLLLVWGVCCAVDAYTRISTPLLCAREPDGTECPVLVRYADMHQCSTHICLPLSVCPFSVLRHLFTARSAQKTRSRFNLLCRRRRRETDPCCVRCRCCRRCCH
jgi:hypothetical protein